MTTPGNQASDLNGSPSSNGRSYSEIDTGSARRRSDYTPRQEQILDELEAIFLAEGFRHLTLKDLTSALHCSRTILYALAPTKEELSLVVIDRFFRKMGVALNRNAGPDLPPAVRLGAALDVLESSADLASTRFFSDIAAYRPAHALHMRHSASAVARIEAIIVEGRQDGSFHSVHALFAAEVVNLVLSRISDDTIPERTGLTTGEAVSELKIMLFDGILAEYGRASIAAAS